MLDRWIHVILGSLLILGLILAASACTPVTPIFGIHVTGTDDLVDVDTAWAQGANLTGIDPFKAARNNWISISFQNTPIEISTQNGEYHGIADETYATVQVVDNCLLDALSPTVHEIVHIQWFILTGGSDPGHTKPGWHEANGDFGPCLAPF